MSFFGLVSYTTELLEIHADDPQMHVLFIPGNPGKFGFVPSCMHVHVCFVDLVLRTRIRGCLLIVTVGVVAFYKDFVESLYEFLEGHVSVTGKTWLLLVLFNLIFYFLVIFCELTDCNFNWVGVLITSYWAHFSHEKGTYTWLIYKIKQWRFLILCIIICFLTLHLLICYIQYSVDLLVLILVCYST